MRDQFLAAVVARLERIVTAQDPALALEPGALDDAQRLAGMLHDDGGDIETRHALGWFHWYRFNALPNGQNHTALEGATQALLPCFIAGVEGLPEPLLPFLAENAVDTAITLLEQMMSTTELTLVAATVSLWQRVLTATPVDHPDRGMYLSNLGSALLIRFERAGAQADLDEAITTYVQAAEAVSGEPSARIRAARSAVSLVAQTDTRCAAGLLETAVRLLPQTASRRLDRGDQQYALGEFPGLASDAAALALADCADAMGEPAVRARRLLELGRGIMLSQALDTRSDVTDLHVRHPVLAARFVELRDQLDQAGDTSVLMGDAGCGERLLLQRHRDLGDGHVPKLVGRCYSWCEDRPQRT